jgi:hypothetical protein
MKKQGYAIVAVVIGLVAIAALLIRQKASAQILVPVQRAENGLMPVSPRFAEVKLDENTTILIETLDAIPIQVPNRADAGAPRTPRDYNTLIEQLGPIVSGIVDAVKRGAVEPDELNVEFGIGFTSTFDVALVNLSGQASLKVGCPVCAVFPC